MNQALPLVVMLQFLTEAPPVTLDDLNRFPPLEICQQFVEFNTQYRIFLQGKASFDNRLSPAYQEAYHLWWIWDCLRFAQDANMPLPGRLYWLSELRECIGFFEYWMGAMPYPIPLQYFRSADP